MTTKKAVGRPMGPVAIVEHIAVEWKSMAPEVREHDEQEAKDLDWLQRALRSLGASAAPHCTPTQTELWQRAHRTMQRLVDANAKFEDPRHVQMFDFADEVAS